MPDLTQDTTRQSLHITLNGEPAELPTGTTLRELVHRLTGREITEAGIAADGGRLGVAVTLDDAVVPRGSWAETVLADGDRVDVVTAVQGG